MPQSNHVFTVPCDSVLITKEAARAIAVILHRREKEIHLRGGAMPPQLVEIRKALQAGSAESDNQRTYMPEWDDKNSDEMTTTEAAEMLNMTDRSVRRLVANGKLPGLKRSERLWIKRMDIERFKDERGET